MVPITWIDNFSESNADSHIDFRWLMPHFNIPICNTTMLLQTSILDTSEITEMGKNTSIWCWNTGFFWWRKRTTFIEKYQQGQAQDWEEIKLIKNWIQNSNFILLLSFYLFRQCWFGKDAPIVLFVLFNSFL